MLCLSVYTSSSPPVVYFTKGNTFEIQTVDFEYPLVAMNGDDNNIKARNDREPLTAHLTQYNWL